MFKIKKYTKLIKQEASSLLKPKELDSKIFKPMELWYTYKNNLVLVISFKGTDSLYYLLWDKDTNQIELDNQFESLNRRAKFSSIGELLIHLFKGNKI